MRSLILGAALLWVPFSHAAFDISPIIATVTPGGPGASTSFTLSNPDDTRTPVQIGIYHRNPDADGREKYEETKDIGDLFQIFPSQIILNAKEKRTVRVTYVGDPKVTREMAFRIIAEEFPINVSDPNKAKNRAVASISIASKYVGSLYVRPADTKPDMKFEVASVKSTKGNDMVLTMDNQGTQHFILRNPKISFSAGNKSYPLHQDIINKIGSQNILAGKVRKFTFPWPTGIPVGALKVNVEVAKE